MSPIAGFMTFWIALVSLLSGCAATIPPSRLNAYVGLHPTPALESLGPLSRKAGRTGLLVFADQTAEEAAPALPEEARTRLTEQLKERLAQSLPIAVETLLPPRTCATNGRPEPIARIGEGARR